MQARARSGGALWTSDLVPWCSGTATTKGTRSDGGGTGRRQEHNSGDADAGGARDCEEGKGGSRWWMPDEVPTSQDSCSRPRRPRQKSLDNDVGCGDLRMGIASGGRHYRYLTGNTDQAYPVAGAG
jgi:hypothetical protein